jgi:hypothetical protein
MGAYCFFETPLHWRRGVILPVPNFFQHCD